MDKTTKITINKIDEDNCMTLPCEIILLTREEAEMGFSNYIRFEMEGNKYIVNFNLLKDAIIKLMD